MEASPRRWSLTRSKVYIEESFVVLLTLSVVEVQGEHVYWNLHQRKEAYCIRYRYHRRTLRIPLEQLVEFWTVQAFGYD